MAKENKFLESIFNDFESVRLGAQETLYFRNRRQYQYETRLQKRMEALPGVVISYYEPDGAAGFGINLGRLEQYRDPRYPVTFENKLIEAILDKAGSLRPEQPVPERPLPSSMFMKEFALG